MNRRDTILASIGMGRKSREGDLREEKGRHQIKKSMKAARDEVIGEGERVMPSEKRLNGARNGNK